MRVEEVLTSGKMLGPVGTEALEEEMRGEHIVIGDLGFISQPAAVTLGPLVLPGRLALGAAGSCADYGNTQRMTAGAAGNADHEDPGLLPEKLDSFLLELSGAEPAYLLLKIFLDSLETASMVAAHVCPPLLGSLCEL